MFQAFVHFLRFDFCHLLPPSLTFEPYLAHRKQTIFILTSKAGKRKTQLLMGVSKTPTRGRGRGGVPYFLVIHFFGDLFGNRFLLVEKSIVTVFRNTIVSIWFVLCDFWFLKWNFDFVWFILFHLWFLKSVFDFKKFLRFIVRRGLRTADCGPEVKCRLRVKSRLQTKG